MNRKILITYFSASGETRKAAEALAKILGGDIHRIEPESPYTAADLNWTNKQSRSSVEMADPTSRPAIAKGHLDISSYDEVLVGFPVWWGIAPTIINTFIEQYDFTGKTVRAFATSGGSGVEKCERSLKTQYPDIDWKAGKLVNSDSAVHQFADMIQ